MPIFGSRKIFLKEVRSSIQKAWLRLITKPFQTPVECQRGKKLLQKHQKARPESGFFIISIFPYPRNQELGLPKYL